MLIARIIGRLYVMKRERSNAADLDRGRPFGPGEMMYVTRHPYEGTSIDDLAPSRVELAAHTGAEHSAEDRHIFIGRMPMRRNLVAVRHLRP